MSFLGARIEIRCISDSDAKRVKEMASCEETRADSPQKAFGGQFLSWEGIVPQIHLNLLRKYPEITPILLHPKLLPN